MKTTKKNTSTNQTTSIDKNYFAALKEELEQFDSKREIVIAKTNDIIKLSKELIYHTNKGRSVEAEKSLAQMQKVMQALQKEVTANPKLDSGSFKVAVQEFVEAICYRAALQRKNLPSHEDLGVSSDYYLLGICDLTGELGRAALNATIDEDYARAREYRDLVVQLFDELSQMNIRNGELRKKIDGVRHEVQKLDKLILDIKMNFDTKNGC